MPHTMEKGIEGEREKRVVEKKGGAWWRKKERKEVERKENELCLVHPLWGLDRYAAKVRVADTRGTRDREPAFHVLLAREKENGAKSGLPPSNRQVVRICIERLKFRRVRPKT